MWWMNEISIISMLLLFYAIFLLKFVKIMMIKTEWFAMNTTQHNPTPNQSCWTDELTYKWMLNVQHGYIPYDEYGFFIYFFFFILSHHVIIVIFLHLHQLTKQPTNSTHWPRLYLLHKHKQHIHIYICTYIYTTSHASFHLQWCWWHWRLLWWQLLPASAYVVAVGHHHDDDNVVAAADDDEKYWPYYLIMHHFIWLCLYKKKY